MDVIELSKKLSAETGLPPAKCGLALEKFGDYNKAHEYLLDRYLGKQSTNDIYKKLTPKEYIERYTRCCSNQIINGGIRDLTEIAFHPWLTPYHAEQVALLAREEVIERLFSFLERQKPFEWVAWDKVKEDFCKTLKEE